MANKTRPAAGSYRLTTDSPSTSVVYSVTNDGIPTTFGLLEWVVDGTPQSTNGHYQSGSVGITFYNDGTFVGSNNGTPYTGTWTAA